MAGMPGDTPPCHGTSIQADDCCLTAATAKPVEIVPVAAVIAADADEGAPAPLAELGRTRPLSVGDAAPPAPLYRLFRALLI